MCGLYNGQVQHTTVVRMAESDSTFLNSASERWVWTKSLFVWGSDSSLTVLKEQGGRRYCDYKRQSREMLEISRRCRWCSVNAGMCLKCTTETDITCIPKMHLSNCSYFYSGKEKSVYSSCHEKYGHPHHDLQHNIPFLQQISQLLQHLQGGGSIWVLSSHMRENLFFHKCFLLRPILNMVWPQQVSQGLP